MSHIYLSYSNQDNELINLIQDDLEGRGYEIWRDTSHIPQNADWGSALETAVSEAHTMIVAASQQSVASDIVNQEIDAALVRGISLVVILLDSCTLPQRLEIPAVKIVEFEGVYQAGSEHSGLEQLRHYRQSITRLINTLDTVYPVRIYLNELKNSDDTIREQAAVKLGELGDLSALQALIKVLADPDSDVRYAATTALGKLGGESTIRPLTRLLNHDDDPDVQAAAAIALGKIGFSAPTSALIEQLNHSDRFVRAGVLNALGRLKASAAVSKIVHIMRNDPISDVRAAAQKALCQIDDNQAKQALRRADVTCE